MKDLASAWIPWRPSLDSCIPCLLESPRTGQNVAHVVVPFVASVLIEVLVAPRHGGERQSSPAPPRTSGRSTNCLRISEPLRFISNLNFS